MRLFNKTSKPIHLHLASGEYDLPPRVWFPAADATEIPDEDYLSDPLGQLQNLHIRKGVIDVQKTTVPAAPANPASQSANLDSRAGKE